MDVFVARQAIFDRESRVFAYELLYRSDQEGNAFDRAEDATAATHVLADSLLSIGLENLLGGKRGFVNFDRGALLGGLHSILPPDSIVIELMESIEPDAQVLEMCTQLRQQGT